MKLLLLILLLSHHFEDPDEIFDYHTPTSTDTINIDAYKIIGLKQKYENGFNPTFMFIVMRDSTILYKVADDKIELYNFNPDTTDAKEPIYAKDIDNDGVKEIIYKCVSRGSAASQYIIIYSLEDIPRLKDTLSGDGGDRLIDIDGDSIPEYKCNAPHLASLF